MAQERIKKYPIRLGASFDHPSSTAAAALGSSSPYRVLDLPDAVHSSNADLSRATATVRRDGSSDRIQATIPPLPSSSTAKPVHLITSSVKQPDQHEVILIFSEKDECFYLERGAPTHTMRLTDHLPATHSSPAAHTSLARSPLSPSYSDTEPMHMDLDSPEPSSGSVLRAPYEAPSVPVSSSASAGITPRVSAAASPLAGYGSASAGRAGARDDGEHEHGEENNEYGDPMDVDSAPPPAPPAPHVHSSDSTFPTLSLPNPPAPKPVAALSDMDDEEEGQISAAGTLDGDADAESTNDLDLELDLEFAGQDEAMRSPTPRGTSVSPLVGGPTPVGSSLGVSRSVSRSPHLPPVSEVSGGGAGATVSSSPLMRVTEDSVGGQEKEMAQKQLQEEAKKKVKIMSLSSRLGLGGGDEEEDEESSSGSESD